MPALPEKNRLSLADNPIQAITKMSEGSPGAVTVLVELMKSEPAIDPESDLGGIGSIMAMDDLGIYGSHIWILFKDVCKSNVGNVVTLFRATRLGLIDSQKVVEASRERVEDKAEPFDFDYLVARIREQVKFWPNRDKTPEVKPSVGFIKPETDPRNRAT
jgi:hypothetical protein